MRSDARTDRTKLINAFRNIAKSVYKKQTELSRTTVLLTVLSAFFIIGDIRSALFQNCCVVLCIVFYRSVYCLYVYLYCTTATGWQPNCS